jgi:phosphoribosylanthranilate isomerase
MKLKVCGMRDPQNIRELIALQPDYIGFIFYEKSPRNVEALPAVDIPKEIKKVGVFVNSPIGFIEEKNSEFNFDLIQLHGDESPDFCKQLHEKGFKIIKAFGINDRFEFSITEHYKAYCSFFLFDTKGKLPGGNGTRFNWTLLSKYDNEIPYFLSGGIDLNNTTFIKTLSRDEFNIHAVDVNSRFELEPALKDIPKVKKLKAELAQTYPVTP